MSTEQYRHDLRVYAERLIAGHDAFMAAIKDRREQIAGIATFQEQEIMYSLHYDVGREILRILEASDTAIVNKVSTYIGKCAVNMICYLGLGSPRAETLKDVVNRLYGITHDYAIEEKRSHE